MNLFSPDFAKHEGLPAKHLREKNEKAMEIKEADVAELVDARDLKSRAATEFISLSCKTRDSEPVETAANPPSLQNIRGAAAMTEKPKYELIDKDGNYAGTFPQMLHAVHAATQRWPDQEQDPERTGKGYDIQVVGSGK